MNLQKSFKNTSDQKPKKGKNPKKLKTFLCKKWSKKMTKEKNTKEPELSIASPMISSFETTTV